MSSEGRSEQYIQGSSQFFQALVLQCHNQWMIAGVIHTDITCLCIKQTGPIWGHWDYYKTWLRVLEERWRLEAVLCSRKQNLLFKVHQCSLHLLTPRYAKTSVKDQTEIVSQLCRDLCPLHFTVHYSQSDTTYFCYILESRVSICCVEINIHQSLYLYLDLGDHGYLSLPCIK